MKTETKQEGVNSIQKPPARAYSGESRTSLRKRLADLMTDDDLEGAISVIRTGLQATKSHWDGVAKRMVEEPDFKTRMEAAKTIVAYKEGMPVQRQMVVQESYESLRDMLRAADHSDEARRLLESEITFVENGTAPHRN